MRRFHSPPFLDGASYLLHRSVGPDRVADFLARIPGNWRASTSTTTSRFHPQPGQPARSARSTRTSRPGLKRGPTIFWSGPGATTRAFRPGQTRVDFARSSLSPRLLYSLCKDAVLLRECLNPPRVLTFLRHLTLQLPDLEGLNKDGAGSPGGAGWPWRLRWGTEAPRNPTRLVGNGRPSDSNSGPRGLKVRPGQSSTNLHNTSTLSFCIVSTLRGVPEGCGGLPRLAEHCTESVPNFRHHGRSVSQPVAPVNATTSPAGGPPDQGFSIGLLRTKFLRPVEPPLWRQTPDERPARVVVSLEVVVQPAGGT